MELNKSFPIKDLNVAPYNPRKMTDDARAGLKASLESLGVLLPVIVNKRGNRICGGHQRVQALQELGHETVPVVFVDLDEKDEMELNLILNSERARGRFLSEPLQDLLEGLRTLPEFSGMRFDVLLNEYQIDLLEDSFEPVHGDERHEGLELSDDKESEEKKDDDTQYLRLHFSLDEAMEVEDGLGAFMKERQIPSMTEAILQMLSEI